MRAVKWPLLAFCSLTACWAIFAAPDVFGIGHASWYGWWQSNQPATGHPYESRFESVEPGSPAARAGIGEGDTFDLREESFEARVGLAFQPIAHKPLTLVLHRNGVRRSLTVVPGTVWDTGGLGLSWAVPTAIACLWLAGCALLIALRRANLFEGRVLALALGLAAVGTMPLVTPNAALTVTLLAVTASAWALVWLAIAILSSAFGTGARWRRVLQRCAYAACTIHCAILLTFIVGVVTLRFDPMPFAFLNFAGSLGIVFLSSCVTVLFVLAAALAAVATTPRAGRVRASWLLLPLPIGLLAADFFVQLQAIVPFSWTLIVVLQALGSTSLVLAAAAVSYAVLKRRVLDFGFVLSRTLVVATVSLIVVASFVLLEYLLGSMLNDVGRAAGVVANAALALVLGVSLRYIHKRVDSFIDSVLFRKRRDDERALRAFSHEAAYVTDREALLDHAIDTVRRHTDACGAALILDGDGRYSVARGFGVSSQSDVDKNDDAILALRAWHKPLDPHLYTTSMSGALAVPMLARGRLAGVLIVGERAGGEAYAPDEVGALAELAHGVGTALDSFSAASSPSASALDRIAARQDDIVAELRALRQTLRGGIGT